MKVLCSREQLRDALSTVTGVPSTNSEMLRFGLWLEPESAEALKTALDRLFETGESDEPAENSQVLGM